MSRIAITLGIALLSFAGCRDQNNQTYAVQAEERSLKPIVAIVPVIDRTINNISWSLSEEMTAAIHERLANRGSIYLVDNKKVENNVKKMAGNNPFGANISWAKKAFRDNEFVVFLELLEHEEVAQNKNPSAIVEKCSAELNTSVRVRVLDLRTPEPKIVLQELIHDVHFIPRQFTQSNFHQIAWGQAGYETSPLGIAHEELTKEISLRLEDYIIHAMNR